MLTYSHICSAFYFHPSSTSEKISNFQRHPENEKASPVRGRPLFFLASNFAALFYPFTANFLHVTKPARPLPMRRSVDGSGTEFDPPSPEVAPRNSSVALK